MKMEKTNKAEKFLEDLQYLIIQQGGKFFYRDELLNMTLKECIESFYPNNIYFSLESKENEDRDISSKK